MGLALKVPTAHLVMHEIADKLNIMHSRNYLHGEVKASNFIYRKGSISLCDFGVSARLSRQRLVNPGLRSSYPAPEQIRGYRYGTPSDVWSLGAVWGDLFSINDTNPMSHQEIARKANNHLGSFQKWRIALFDARGRFCCDRVLEDTSTLWGFYFAARMRRDLAGTAFVLDRMLDPNPLRRASASEVADFFAPQSAYQCARLEDAAHTLSRGARTSIVSRTLAQLRAVLEFNRDAEAQAAAELTSSQ